MAYFENIIKRLETNLKVHVHGTYHARTEIDSVLFWNTNTSHTQHPEGNILYLCDAAHFHGVPADEYILVVNYPDCELPAGCLCISQTVALDEVFNQIQTVILEHHLLKCKEEELFRTLQHNNGLQGITNIAYTHLNNPITICDTSFSVLAASPQVAGDTNLEEKDGRLFVKDSKFQNMLDTKLVKKIYSTTVPFITYIEDYPFQWVYQSIRIRHSVVGYVCVREIQKDFVEEDLEYIDMFCHVIAIEMQREMSFQTNTRLNYEYFLTELLEGHFSRKEYILNNMIQLGHQPGKYYFLLVIDEAPDNHNSGIQLKNLYQQVLTILPNSMAVFFYGKLTVLLPTDSYKPFSDKTLTKFYAFLQFHQLYAYVSFPYENIAESHIFYKQAAFLSSFYSEHTLTPEDYIVYYRNHFLQHTFALCKDFTTLKSTIHPDIYKIIRHDQTQNTDYANTLKTYLMNGRNAVRASEELHIHKSTFFYRLNKMEELFDLDMIREETMVAYEYSFILMDYLEKSKL